MNFITKSFDTIEGEQFVNTIDFNYNIFYVDKRGNELKATTKAFTKAYNYDQQFILPYFNFTKHYHEDYRNMTLAPYDSVFWNGTTEFRFYDRLQEIENFIQANKIQTSIMNPKSKKDSMYAQLQFPYISWNENRFKMGQSPPDVIVKSINTNRFEIDRYRLNVKLYLDINHVRDSLTYQLRTILDPVGSYYHFPISDFDLAFMNIYFDLMEI